MCLLCLLLCGCSDKTMSADEASEWIEAYAPASVDQDTKIRIEMTDKLAGLVKYQEHVDKCVQLSPRVKGAVEVNPILHYIDFIPEKSLKPGKQYTCRLKMARLTGVKSLPDFVFSFRVEKRQMQLVDVKVGVDPDDCTKMMVSGTIEYNSPVGEKVTGQKDIIEVSDPKAKVNVGSDAAKHQRHFCVQGIERTDKERKVELSLRSLADFATTGATVMIPATNGFELLRAERHDEAEPYIELSFSAPLSMQQELDGLITINNIDRLRFERQGAEVKVYYPSNAVADLTLQVSELLKNNEGHELNVNIERHFKQEAIPPAIRLPFGGHILPDNGNLKFPFKAVNLAAVDVEVVKLFPANVMSFLQENEWKDFNSLRRYGRLIYRHTVRLDTDKSVDLHKWQNFSVDLKNLFARDRGAVYNIRLTFKKAYSLYNRSEAGNIVPCNEVTPQDNATWDVARTCIYRDAPESDYDNFCWAERKDPTKDSFYMCEDYMPEVNLVASNLGLIVKRASDNEVKAIVTNMLTASPVPGIAVTAYNFQLQKVGEGTTDDNGFADFKTRTEPFMVTAADGRSTTYLKVRKGYELPTAKFDVEGIKPQGGIKGFVYGDRGVWRPGDEIHLTLIVEDLKKTMPDNHPVVMELYTPGDRLYERRTLTEGVDGFYVFNIFTKDTDPTGLWEAKFKVGNATFRHAVRIETIKPNRLKLNIVAPEILVAGQADTMGVEARWLSGPTAKRMDARLNVEFFANPVPFAKYRKYLFSNPLRSYNTTERELMSGQTDGAGVMLKKCRLETDINAPGMLQANITATVAEPGGETSTISKSVPFSPFGVYVGIDLGKKEFEADKDLSFPVVVVNANGQRLKARHLNYKIYRLDWIWWWEGTADDLSRYVKSASADLVSNGFVTAVNGFAEIPFRAEADGCDKYLVLVRDTVGGHATGGVINVSSPDWNGGADSHAANASTELAFSLNKQLYEVGEMAHIYLPPCKGGRVLLSIENGTSVLERVWVPLSESKETDYRLVVDQTMAPNFYVTATMVRPHNTTDFDTPLRLFGVQSVKVLNPGSVLRPVITMPERLKPQQTFTVSVSEQNNRPMTYTLAIVDEGLLDISNFLTPRPWVAMNRKQALGVKTWDMFYDVIGAFGSNFRSVLSVGGDEALRKAVSKEKRFNPVVMFVGPVTLQGGTQTHTLTMPNYVGSARVMVVAAHNGSYGHADKTVGVSAPLMAVPTYPRTLANADTVNVPVNVLAMDNTLSSVDLRLTVDGPAKVVGAKHKRLLLNKADNGLACFKVVASAAGQGKARFIVTATGNGLTVRDTTFVEVANPMPRIVEAECKSVAAQSEAEFELKQGYADAVLQLSPTPSLNFRSIELFMESYPHLCTEQLASKALFMLHGRDFLDKESENRCEKELPRVLKTLADRQLSSGGLAYWASEDKENTWATSLAGMAFAEACRQGFRVDETALKNWRTYQENTARSYRHSAGSDLDQGLRLYSLALAGFAPPAPMNRLRESKELTRAAAYSLACAYAETGRTDVAIKLIERAETARNELNGGSFYTPGVADALALQAYSMCGLDSKALKVARNVSERFSSASYVTQDVALATMVMRTFNTSASAGACSAQISVDGNTLFSISDFVNLKSVRIPAHGRRVRVVNPGSKPLELMLTSSHVPSVDRIAEEQSKGLSVRVTYADRFGKRLKVDRVKQNDEFKALITVVNVSGHDIDNAALSFGIPAGWEIVNTIGSQVRAEDCYRDIRDNAANHYFAISQGETKRFEVKLRAAVEGNYLLPPTVCEDMYDAECCARTASGRVAVTR